MEFVYSHFTKYFAKKLNFAPIRVFVGSTPYQDLVVKVLNWSIKKHTKYPFEIHPLHEYEINFSMPKDKENLPGTPFSFQRFTIPEICNYQGRAIYMDSDQIATDDLGKLFYRPMGKNSYQYCKTEKQGKIMQRASVLLLDCSQLDWKIGDIINDLDNGKYTYKELMTKCPIAKHQKALPNKWNDLDRYEQSKTGIIHYTDKSTQPWLNTNHKNICSDIWFDYLFEAVDNGYIAESEIDEAVEKNLVRPSIRYQLKNRERRVSNIPEKVKLEDQNFLDFCSKYRFNTVPGEYRGG